MTSYNPWSCIETYDFGEILEYDANNALLTGIVREHGNIFVLLIALVDISMSRYGNEKFDI